MRNKKIRIKKEKGISPNSAAPPLMETGNKDNKSKGPGDLRYWLRSRQKPGVSFPCDSYSTKELPPDLEAFAMMQYNLKRGLRNLVKMGSLPLGNKWNNCTHERWSNLWTVANYPRLKSEHRYAT
jgi:hypothetical protein